MSKKKFDPVDILKNILENDFDLGRFNPIDDSGFQKAPNFLEWCIGKEYANSTVLPWQVEAGMKLFSDYCPKCSNPEYLDDLFDESISQLKDNVVFLEHGICPKCKKNRLELFTAGVFEGGRPSVKNEFIAAAGQRSGKSKNIALFTSYQTHRWLTLADPVGFLDLPRMEVIVGTFSALSSDQAELNLWLPFKGLYDNSPWFKKYNEFLKDKGKSMGLKLYEDKETFIAYPHKRLLLEYTGSDDRKKRGATRLFGAIDEIAFLNSEEAGRSKKKVMDADKNYAALNNSLATIRRKVFKKFQDGFFDAPMAIMYNASSPLNVQDKIMRLVRQAPNNPMAVAVHKATWELNPDYTEQDCRQINPNLSEVEFQRDFGAIPPFSDAPFFTDPRVFERIARSEIQSPVSVETVIHEDSLGDRYLYLKAKVPKVDKMTPRLLSLDNGYKQNAFAVTLFRYDAIQKKPILEFAASLSPEPSAGLTVHFPMMFQELILPMLANLRIQHVFYDRWQSLDQIQRLRDLKIDARAYSLSYGKDFLPLRQQIISGNIYIPALERPIFEIKEASNPLAEVRNCPVAKLVWQSLTVRDSAGKLIKPLEGDDDLFRAFALGASRFAVEEIQKEYQTWGGVKKAMGSGGAVGAAQTFRKTSGGGSNASAGQTGRFVKVRLRSK